ncbi:MAG: SEL1-like repeat protein [Deltaproteobacteria bacterium]|nr:SEL1-like repeat protein [Deltaproteobacteria bacterium]
MRRLPGLAGATAVVGAAVVVGVACSPAEAVRPAAPTYGAAAGVQSCAVVEGRNEPFIVDWRADKRADLEAALARGLVVVAYDCNRLQLLSDCTAGSDPYTFAAITPKEQLLRLDSADEIRAAFPLTGAALSGKIGADLSRGSTLDVGLAIIGKRSSVKPFVLRTELRGQCDGATHFVRAATVGAFAMRTGTRGSVRAAVDLFGAVQAASTSAEVVENRDGVLEACRGSKLDADKAPAQCGTPLRLELREVRSTPPPASAIGSDADEIPRCPKGLLPAETGVCVPRDAPVLHLCAPEDPADCGIQCEKGSLSSCAILGRSYAIGRGVPHDLSKAKTILTAACDKGSAQACGRLAEVHLAEKELAKASALFEKACSAGWFTACETMGKMGVAFPGMAKVDVYAMFKRSCAGGDAEGCWGLGSLFSAGLGVRKSDKEAFPYFRRACEGGAKLGCVSLAKLLDAGVDGEPGDPAAAIKLLDSSCERAFYDACSALANYYLEGRGVAKDEAKAVSLLERACGGTARGACVVLGVRAMSGSARDDAKSQRYFTRACESGFDIACAQLRK